MGNLLFNTYNPAKRFFEKIEVYANNYEENNNDGLFEVNKKKTEI